MNVNRCPTSEADDCHWPDRLAANYPLVEDVVKFIAHRHRLTPDDQNELGSLVRLRMVEDNYRILRRYQHRSSMKTYLTTVISRIWLDWQVARRGKWRPSTVARRQGDTAVRLERLLFRDRLSFEEACETLRVNGGIRESVAQLDRMHSSFHRRPRPTFCSLEEVDRRRCTGFHGAETSDSRSMTSLRHRALFQAMERLSSTERRLLTFRFVKGWTVSRIARHLGINQKAAYRQFERIYRTMRASIADRPHDPRSPFLFDPPALKSKPCLVRPRAAL